MHKSLKLKAAIGGMLCCALTAQGAAAQSASNNQLLNAGLNITFSAADVTAMLGEFSIPAALQPYEGYETANVLALIPNGARFVVALFECDDPETGLNCKAAAIYTGFSNAGVAYDDLNQFNSNSQVTRVVNVSEQNIIIFGTQIFFNGGIGRENFKHVTRLFLTDVHNYFEAKAAAGTTVSLDVAPSARGKVDNLVPAEDAIAPSTAMRARYDLDQALRMAISNTWDVRFALEVD